MYIIGFNGPPRSGKDTLSSFLASHLDSVTDIPIREMSLSQPMREMAYGALGREYSDADYERIKDSPTLGMTTLREFMIGISERFMKLSYGKNIWCDLLRERLHGFDGILLIRDFGFQHEIDYFEQTYSPEQVYLVQTQRVDHGWENDSRQRCTAQQSDFYVNDGGLAEWQYQAVGIVTRLKQLGWEL